MMKDFFKTVEITKQTESGIQIANSRIIIPKASLSASNSGIIIPTSGEDLIKAIENSKKNKNFSSKQKKDCLQRY